MDNGEKALFSVYAEAKDYDKPLYLINLTFARLIEDVVIPFDKGESFIIDGVSLDKKQILRLKILQQKEKFLTAFCDLHHGMRRREKELQKTLGEQYHIRLDAAFREGCEDVTSQMLKAYKLKIKPSLVSSLIENPELIRIASDFFVESIKALGKPY